MAFAHCLDDVVRVMSRCNCYIVLYFETRRPAFYHVDFNAELGPT